MTDTAPIPPELIDATRAKLEAEVAELHANIYRARAEGRKFAAEADQAEHDAAVSAIQRRNAERKEADELAADRHHHVYVFDKEVSAASATACKNQLTQWVRTAPGPVTVELVIDSPGGSVFDGFHLIDFITFLHDQGHTVNTTAFGMAASMAGVLLQAGVRRRMGANSMLLIHEASFSAGGSFGRVEDQVTMVEKMHDRILTLFAARAANSDAADALTKRQIERRWKRKDWWLTADEAKRFGFVDEVR